MSDVEVVMKFELLPNEILIECFEYLNAPDIFYSFDQLNYRFHEIIRSIPLCLNFRNIHRFKFHQFCMQMQSNPDIKQQIISIHLFNKDTCGQIEAFLSMFSLIEFPHLQALTLTAIRRNHMEKLNSMLPFISQLRSFRLAGAIAEVQELVSDMSMSLFQTLSLPSLISALKSAHRILPTTYITTSDCSLAELHQLLQCVPMLKYLNVKRLRREDHTPTNNQQYCTGHHALHLKQLIINRCECRLQDFVMIVKQTPNLKVLMVFADYNEDMIDACRWQHLITLSLTHLKIFKFKFDVSGIHINENIVKRFEGFQSDFWEVQRYWCTEYVFSKNTALIYTIPYPSNTYTISSDPIRYFSKTMNTSSSFDNVTDLILSRYIPIVVEDQSYFSNVTSLTINHTFGLLLSIGDLLEHKFGLYLSEEDGKYLLQQDKEDLLERNFVRFLKTIINLSHLKHLNIRSITSMKTSLVLLEILKEAPQLSSLGTIRDILLLLFIDDELCKYMNKMIRKLYIYDIFHTSLDRSGSMEQFCEVFSKIEELECIVDKPDGVLYLLCHLKKLSILKVFLNRIDNRERTLSWIKNEAQKLGLSVFIEYDVKKEKLICIWIHRNMNLT
jgi:hypothetical protein